MIIQLSKPLIIDDVEHKELDLKVNDLTGEDILKVDLELRTEGQPNGMDNIMNQNVLVKIASKASGILPDDLKKLPMVDFIEVTFSVRNFLLGWSANQEEQKTSEESSSN